MGPFIIERESKAGIFLSWVSIFIFMVLLLAVSRPTAEAQESEDLRAKTQNPVGAMISVPLKNTFDFGAPNGTAYFLNIQPVIPVTVGDWNLINRVILPIIPVDGPIAGTPSIPQDSPVTALPVSGTSITPYSSRQNPLVSSFGASVPRSAFPPPPMTNSAALSGAPGPRSSSLPSPSPGPWVRCSGNSGPLRALLPVPT